MTELEDFYKIMPRILAWAYRHDIEVLIFKESGTHGYGEYPVVRFSRGDKYMQQALFPLYDVTARLKDLWGPIGFKLCVEPPDFEGL